MKTVLQNYKYVNFVPILEFHLSLGLFTFFTHSRFPRDYQI